MRWAAADSAAWTVVLPSKAGVSSSLKMLSTSEAAGIANLDFAVFSLVGGGAHLNRFCAGEGSR